MAEPNKLAEASIPFQAAVIIVAVLTGKMTPEETVSAGFFENLSQFQSAHNVLINVANQVATMAKYGAPYQ